MFRHPSLTLVKVILILTLAALAHFLSLQHAGFKGKTFTFCLIYKKPLPDASATESSAPLPSPVSKCNIRDDWCIVDSTIRTLAVGITVKCKYQTGCNCVTHSKVLLFFFFTTLLYFSTSLKGTVTTRHIYKGVDLWSIRKLRFKIKSVIICYNFILSGTS